jgi:hypothetical protein
VNWYVCVTATSVSTTNTMQQYEVEGRTVSCSRNFNSAWSFRANRRGAPKFIFMSSFLMKRMHRSGRLDHSLLVVGNIKLQCTKGNAKSVPKIISGSIPGRGKEFSLLHDVQTGSGAHTPSYSTATGVKRLGCKADQSHLSSADVEWWSCTTIPNTSSWRRAY